MTIVVYSCDFLYFLYNNYASSDMGLNSFDSDVLGNNGSGW